jgi:hypothetical protein
MRKAEDGKTPEIGARRFPCEDRGQHYDSQRFLRDQDGSHRRYKLHSKETKRWLKQQKTTPSIKSATSP